MGHQTSRKNYERLTRCNYNPNNEHSWICEHNDQIIGFLLLMNRGIGLGKKLMELYMEFLHQCNYATSYLWTTHELYAAANLYKRHGFQLVEEKVSDAFGKPLKEQKYELTF